MYIQFMILGLYSGLMRLSTPLLALYLRRRRRLGKEDAGRAPERRGIASRPRPAGRLVWLHAASVGESLSLLPVIDAILKDDPQAHALVTTGTVNSAKLMAARLPPCAFHQYVPVDHPRWAARFLDHWRPDAAVWTESEIWPNLLSQLRARRVPAVLLNARLSAGSFARWQKFPATARTLLSSFRHCFAQDGDEAARLSALGAPSVEVAVNLKYAADPLPFDATAREKLAARLGDTPRLLWASTHAGEEEMAFDLHRRLRAESGAPLVTIVVPRHPARGDAIMALPALAEQTVARRSTGAPPPEDGIYLADTLGELGLFYSLCQTVVMGGTFADIGGHNLIEPAQAGCAVFCGPQTYNFKTVMRDFTAAGAVVNVASADDLARRLGAHLAGTDAAAAAAGAAAQAFVAGQKAAIAAMIARLLPMLRGGEG